MTAPLGFRTVHPPAAGTTTSGRAPAIPARPIPLPIDVVNELTSTSGTRPIPKDHLDLIRALIEAGKFSRAIELLDSVWQLDSTHEQAWYYRLWATIGEGKDGTALELARTIVPRLPGSVAIAFLQAHLEEHAGDPKAALESALRASAAGPGRPEPATLIHRLVALVAEEAGGRPALSTTVPNALPGQPAPEPLSLMGAALQGAALLHPAESSRPQMSVLPPRIRQPESVAPRKTPVAKRFGLLALATVIAALWAIPDPVPAAIALAIVVVVVTRSMPRASRGR
jgi:hypothetical protein